MDDKPLEITIDSDQAMRNLGKTIASVCLGGEIILLYGNLGAGKTTFARGFIQGKGFTHRVKSPTFTLVEPYEIAKLRIYHFDLYRLESPEELELIGWRDYLHDQSICLIEWPDNANELMPKDTLNIHIDIKLNNVRTITLKARDKTFLKKLKQAIHDA